MPSKPRGLRFIEARLRKMTFGILSTVDPGGGLQTPSILYGVSPPGAGFRLDVPTEPPSDRP